MTAALKQHFADLNARLQVQECVDRLCSSVETISNEAQLQLTKKQLNVAMRMTKHFASRIEDLQAKNSTLEHKMLEIKDNAKIVKEKLAIDISQVLIESRRAQKIQETVKTLKSQIKEQKGYIATLKGTEEEYKAQIQYLHGQEKKSEMTGGGDELESYFSSIQVEKEDTTKEEKAPKNINPSWEMKENTSTEIIATLEDKKFISINSSTSANGIDEASVNSEGEKEEKGGKETSSPFQAIQSESDSLRNSDKDTVLASSDMKCLLRDVEDVELLHVFSFLETAEVLSAAQANRFVFQRVDELFGLDSKITCPNWALRIPSSLEDTESKNEDDALKELDDLLNNSTRASNDSLPGKKQVSEKNEEEGSGGVANFLTSFTASIASHIKPTAVLAEIDPETSILPESVLELLGLKLTAAEMTAIKGLNDKAQSHLRRTEEIEHEKDDVQARLVNAETVRDFLVSKLKSAEMALKASLKECAQYRRQAAADSEVISFLDLKSQELEGSVQESDFKRQQLQAALNLAQGSSAHAERSLRSELLSTKNRLEEGESSFKSQKKLLVKEVKNLRATVERLSDEKNILIAQLSQVRIALGENLEVRRKKNGNVQMGNECEFI